MCRFLNFRSDSLFDMWNKYEHKLPPIYYQKKLLELGDFLVSIKVRKWCYMKHVQCFTCLHAIAGVCTQEYSLALHQCYGRYLRHFGDLHVEEITEVTEFKNNLFPKGFATEDAGFTVCIVGPLYLKPINFLYSKSVKQGSRVHILLF